MLDSVSLVRNAAYGITQKRVGKWDHPSIAGRGAFTPKYVVLHHTGGRDSLELLRSGGDHAPVPGANFLVGRDGTVYILSGFQTYHAGIGGPYGDVPKDMMNHYSFGIEIESLGRDRDLEPVQIGVVARLASNLLKGIGQPVSHVINHRDWAPGRKIDTLYDIKWWRERILAAGGGVAVAPEPYQVYKVTTDQVFPLNKWVKADIGKPNDAVLPPVGSDDFEFQLHLSLGTLTCERNDIRYVKGRWARHEPQSPDANAAGLDTTGTDTKAVSMDIPKDSWQGNWVHGFKGEAKVPVSFWVFIGSMKPGTVKSPMRIYKAEDETS